MRQTFNVFGVVFSIALTLSGATVLFQIPGVFVLVAGTLLAMTGLLLLGLFLARTFSYVDSRRRFTTEQPSHRESSWKERQQGSPMTKTGAS